MAKQSFTKSMESRHLITLSLGGVIGTGIFMSSGYLIQSAGAVGTIIAYGIGALLVCLVMLCLGELTVHDPNTGAFHRYASEYISPGVGFVTAWLYWLTWTIALGSEFVTLAILIQKWFPSIPTWILTIIFTGLIFAINSFNITLFNRAEFWMSIVKVLALVAFIVIGLGMIFKIVPVHHANFAPFFKEIVKPGLFPNGFAPIFSVILAANFAFSGTEMISVAAGETDNPKKAIPKAIFQTLVILIVLFIGTIVVMGALLPQKSAALTDSPFIAVLDNSGIPYASDIMNFILFITVLSAANSGVYAASRMIWSLADQKTLPKRLAKLSKHGIPVYGLLLTIFGGLLALFSSIYSPKLVYLALTAISSFAVVTVWLIIGWAQLNFRKQFLATGHQVSDLSYRTPAYPLVPWLVIIICLISLVGIASDPNQRIALEVGIPFSILCYGYYQLIYRKKLNQTNGGIQNEQN
ncbi:amino acid permease [Lactobacillus sp. Sy-1]|uniref:amino acid permease n=1 Tax=Lactobacillus sp. Sy-1 TaxID=2109645 RepID=UPI001C566421|nr:amino acid permease [Lactobacillus sp. Sy-1]MBW1605236.1 amino acid permease [Lactobacillus sp. Sy-1]